MSGAIPDPEHLLLQAKDGDREALGALLELYRNYLELLARMQIGRRFQGKVDAADLIQETFLAAHRDIGRFRGHTEAELVSWLREILACNLTDLVRRYWGLVAASSSPSQRAVRREQAVLLADALRTLPADYGEVLFLHYLQGLTFPEVSRRMGRSLDSVKKLWVRALARLRQILGGAS
jgi:RNA polymerase sigma-70 factor (ECF subfamily)